MYPTECMLPTLHFDMKCLFKVHKVVNMSVSVRKLCFYTNVNPCNWKKHTTKQNVSLVRQEDTKMLTWKVRLSTPYQNNLFLSWARIAFHCDEEIVVIHLIFFQTSKGQNIFRPFIAMRNWKIYLYLQM